MTTFKDAIHSWAQAGRPKDPATMATTTATTANPHLVNNGVSPASIPDAREAAPPDKPALASPTEPKEAPILKRFAHTFNRILFSSWVNALLVFVPVGIACNFAKINPTIVFVMNAIAIVPLAGLLGYATESVAHCLGDTLGALLNVSFGNAVELIILWVSFYFGWWKRSGWLLGDC